MIELTLDEVLNATGGRPMGKLPEGNISLITADSRLAVPGTLFIALKGEKVDGHDYIAGISDKLIAALVEHETAAPVPQIKVDSTYKALGQIGAYIRRKSGVTVVGVTGSVGKTSVKELTASVLSQKFSVLKTEKNHNNELGLPMTLFRLEKSHEVAVLEMGISYFGEMTRVSAIAQPDIAIFTNIENVHTENLIDRDGVLRAKTELVANMRGDTLILNADDDKLAGYKLPEGKRAVYYGIEGHASVMAKDVVYNGIDSTDFTLVIGQDSILVRLPASGRHMVLDALAAAAAGRELGLGPEEIKRGIESYVTVSGRMTRIEHNGAIIIDDCYNASPTSMIASLGVLAKASGRRIALLGDMLELGEKSDELHESVGRAAAQLKIDMLVGVGVRASHIVSAARGEGLENAFLLDRDEAADLIKKELRAGDTLLVKASRGMKLEELIKKIRE